MKNILLATIGSSPQVLTETLYAIHQNGKPFPDEIFVITTLCAKQSLIKGLFEDNHLQELKREYNLPNFLFNESHIWLIEDNKGNPISDAKSVMDQTYMADFITRKLFELTQNPNTLIHASLAGGRKTMAFYLGYAMSLLGREQDILSHVFVDNTYEFIDDFWFPTKESKLITGKDDKKIDASKAKITLAEIPFVRMRNSVNQSLINSMIDHSFSQTVAMLNATQHQELNVDIFQANKSITVHGIEIKLTAKEMAFYLWLLSKGNSGVLVDRFFEEKKTHSLDFLNYFKLMSTDPRVYESFDTTPEDFAEANHTKLKGMNKTFLQPVCSMINRKLTKSLPREIAHKICINSQQIGTSQEYSISLNKKEYKIHAIYQ